MHTHEENPIEQIYANRIPECPVRDRIHLPAGDAETENLNEECGRRNFEGSRTG